MAWPIKLIKSAGSRNSIFRTLIFCCCFICSLSVYVFEKYGKKTTQIILRHKCLRYFWSSFCYRKPVCTLIISIALRLHQSIEGKLCSFLWNVCLPCCLQKIPYRIKCITSIEHSIFEDWNVSNIHNLFIQLQKVHQDTKENSIIFKVAR